MVIKGETVTVNTPRERALKLTGFPAAVVEITPPEACVDFHEFQIPSTQVGVSLVNAWDQATVDEELHSDLLHEGVRKHRRLWKSLASR